MYSYSVLQIVCEWGRLAKPFAVQRKRGSRWGQWSKMPNVCGRKSKIRKIKQRVRLDHNLISLQWWEEKRLWRGEVKEVIGKHKTFGGGSQLLSLSPTAGQCSSQMSLLLRVSDYMKTWLWRMAMCLFKELLCLARQEHEGHWKVGSLPHSHFRW